MHHDMASVFWTVFYKVTIPSFSHQPFHRISYWAIYPSRPVTSLHYIIHIIFFLVIQTTLCHANSSDRSTTLFYSIVYPSPPLHRTNHSSSFLCIILHSLYSITPTTPSRQPLRHTNPPQPFHYSASFILHFHNTCYTNSFQTNSHNSPNNKHYSFLQSPLFHSSIISQFNYSITLPRQGFTFPQVTYVPKYLTALPLQWVIL